MGHALMENRSGLMLGACPTRADGQAERVAALALIEPFADRPRSITLAADKDVDAEETCFRREASMLQQPLLQPCATSFALALEGD